MTAPRGNLRPGASADTHDLAVIAQEGRKTVDVIRSWKEVVMTALPSLIHDETLRVISSFQYCEETGGESQASTRVVGDK